MDFQGIHNDTACDCINDLKQDTENIYVRKINRPAIRDTDLRSHWEKGKRVDDSDCKAVCGYKGLSVNVWNNLSEKDVIGKFLTTFGISRKSKDSIYLFKFKVDAGLLKYTPNERDPYHYTFYKCDAFTADMIEEVEVKELRDFLKDNETI